MINERDNAVLLSAGLTQREINTQRQKFYNLFRLEPYLAPMRKVGEWVDLTDEQIEAALLSVDPATKRLPSGMRAFAQAVGRALKKENT